MKGLASQRGFTMIEAIVALAITGFLMSILGTSFFLLSQTPAQLGDQLTALEDLRFAARWLTRDGSLAQTFTAGTSPPYAQQTGGSSDYGYFSWTDYTGAVSVTRATAYTYSGTQLLRQEYQGSTLVDTQAVARNIAGYGDVNFQYVATQFVFNPASGLWSLSGGSVTATLTSTVRFTGNPTDQVVSTTVVSQLRAQAERAVSAPGPTPIPPPLPGEVVYYCAILNLISGSPVSGGCAQLNTDDTAYYVVSSGGGDPKYVRYEITSQAITLTTISAIDIVFVGRSDKKNNSQQFFVYNPTDTAHTDGGYHPTLADQAFTYATANEDKSSGFPLDSADVSYINSLGTKVVKIKVVVTTGLLGPSFNLSSDQFIFKVR